MVINSDFNSKISHRKSQLNSSLSLEDFEDLQDLRQAKKEQENEPTYSLEQVRAMINDLSL